LAFRGARRRPGAIVNVTLRVVLYGEGGREVSGELGPPPRSGEVLIEKALGPAHVLVRRCLELARGLPDKAVQFEAPVRDSRARVARGTALYAHRQTLRRLLTWADASMRPELAIVLVDCDGFPRRKAELDEWVADLPVTKVIGVAADGQPNRRFSAG